MFINQLSIFIENKEGRLEKALEALKKEDVNIISLSLADTCDYGVLRMIVSDPEAGKAALKAGGFSVMITDVLAVKLAHRVGYLQELLGAICRADINIEYMYALSTGTDDASIILKTSDLAQAEAVLRQAGVEIFTKDDLARIS